MRTTSGSTFLGLPFIYDPMPQGDFLGDGGICYRDRASGAQIDTIIIHSCYVEEPIIHPVLIDSAAEISEESARSLMRDWIACQKNESLERDPLARAKLSEHNQNLRALAQHVLIKARHGEAGLAPFNRQAIKDIFQFNGVSAHYLLDRDGEIFEFVAPERQCFHAGTSRLPAGEDMREAVNDFSIGIELMGTHVSGFTDAQYQNLGSLCCALAKLLPVKNILGHEHVAVPRGRKTDPWHFDWARFEQNFRSDPDIVESGRSFRFPTGL